MLEETASDSTPAADVAPTTLAEESITPPATAPPLQLREYHLVQEKSEVRFLIDELLLGNEKTVIGSTSQMTATVLLDLAQPRQTQMSTIEVDAHTFVTDDSFRNRALRGQILNTDEPGNRLITFAPSEIDNLPEVIGVGDTAELQLIGDLTISGITQSTVLTLTVELQSEEQLVGSGQTTVNREEFGLTIPKVPGVANVATDVIIEVDFVAEASNP